MQLRCRAVPVSLSALASLKVTSTAWSRSATVREAFAGLPFLLPTTSAVASALAGAYYGVALWTKLSGYQERRACLRLDHHSSLLFRFTRRELGLFSARAANDEWLSDWVTAPPPVRNPQWEPWTERLLREWGVTPEDEEALSHVEGRHSARQWTVVFLAVNWDRTGTRRGRSVWPFSP